MAKDFEDSVVLGYVNTFTRKDGKVGYRVNMKEDADKEIVRNIFMNAIMDKDTGKFKYFMITQVGETRPMTDEDRKWLKKDDGADKKVVKGGKKVKAVDF